jgi:hypothetical protein
MATKTKAKTAAKKSAAHKPVATHKSAPAKAQVPKKKVEPHPKPAHVPPPAKAQVHRAAEEKPHPKPGAGHRPAVESVSLIDKKHRLRQLMERSLSLRRLRKRPRKTSFTSSRRSL